MHPAGSAGVYSRAGIQAAERQNASRQAGRQWQAVQVKTPTSLASRLPRTHLADPGNAGTHPGRTAVIQVHQEYIGRKPRWQAGIWQAAGSAGRENLR